MSLLSWNCQGARGKETVQRLREIRKNIFPDFLFLLETKQKSEYVLSLKNSFGYEELVTVDPIGLSGGLAVMWKKGYDVTVLISNKRIIDLQVSVGSTSFYLTCVYGDPIQSKRKEVWNQLTQLGLSRDASWMLVGDFNELMSNKEKSGGAIRPESSFWDFKDMAVNCKIKELKSTGNSLSWAGIRENSWVQCQLDRSFGNDAWFTQYPSSHMEYMDMWGSDHRPLLIKFSPDSGSMGKGRFYFDKRLCSKPGIDEIIRKSWMNSNHSSSVSLTDKLAVCRKDLSSWKRSNDMNSASRIKSLHQKLEHVLATSRPCIQVIRQTKHELAVAYKEEEDFWKQKCREQWLRSGDQNTQYFHNCVKGRKVRNRVLWLKDQNGIEQFAEGSKGNIAVNYFKDLFTSSNPYDMDSIFVGLSPRVSADHNVFLTAPILDEEIKVAAFGINGGSTPGVDGFTGSFYKRFWHIIGPTITSEVKSFFNSAIMPSDWNHTQLFLLPKITSPSLMSDMRPISFCTVQYKIISRILCGRLKKVLHEIVSDTQGAFVSGRLITDNILIAHEMVHALRTDTNISRDYMAVKTDMSKAFDRVEWSFLETLLEKLGFDRIWVRWIMSCVSTVTYSVLLNGQQHGHIKPERGIRQGDPLSPFLFILAAEALVNIMNQSVSRNLLSGISISSTGPSIQHLLFADDSLFLCKANVEESIELINSLSAYGEVSGQMINYNKSSIIFGSKVAVETKVAVKNTLKIATEGGEGSYLGLPESFSGSKRKLLNFIQEKLQSRLKGWYAKSLSSGGKEVLLKSIGLALPVYAMSCFKLTKGLCEKLTSAMRDFWWSSGTEKRKIPWVAWTKLCKRREEGGLGFHDISGFNQALLGKQAWRLWSQPSSLLAQVYKHRYYPRTSLFDCNAGAKPSYAWRSILFGRELLHNGLMKAIGNGKGTKVWSDKWLLYPEPKPPDCIHEEVDLELTVHQLLCPATGSWNADLVHTLFTASDARQILKINTSLGTEDSFLWPFTNSGEYTSQSGYKFWDSTMNLPETPSPPLPPLERKIWTQLWRIPTMPKIRHFLWKALAGALPVYDQLRSRHIRENASCPACSLAPETINHMLFHCEIASEVWSAFPNLIPAHGFSQTSILLNFYHLMRKCNDKNDGSMNGSGFPWLLWQLWKARNLLVFEHATTTAANIINKATDDLDAWFSVHKPSLRESVPTQSSHLEPGRWRSPHPSFVKCNVGASWKHSSPLSGAAWILRDEHGSCLSHGRRAYSHLSSALEADLHALFWSVESMGNIHPTKLIFELSSAQAIEAVKNPHRFPLFRILLNQIHSHLLKFTFWRFTLTSKEINSPAQDIAQSVIASQRHASYIAANEPSWLKNRLLVEAQQCKH